MILSKIRIMIYEGHKNESPLYERFNNVQHGFMKALKMCISFL